MAGAIENPPEWERNPPGWENKENCGEPMSPPNWVQFIFNKEKAAAANRFQACYQRNNGSSRKSVGKNGHEIA
jgi:hypothetical protein